MTGWIMLHRKFIDWEWYDDMNAKSLFIHLMLMAQHKPTKYRGKDINRGQLVTGRRKLSSDLGISEKAVRIAMEKLKSTGEIEIEGANTFSIVTVCNYSLYNNESCAEGPRKGHMKGQRRANEGPTKGHMQECNNDKNEKNERKITPKGFLIANSIDWIKQEVWDEWIDHKRKTKASVSIRALKANISELEKFGTEHANNIICQSLDSGWKGLFALKGDSRTNGRNDGATDEYKAFLDRVNKIRDGEDTQ